MPASAVVVGSRDDPHVAAVLEALGSRGQPSPLVIDAEVLRHAEYLLSAGDMSVRVPGQQPTLVSSLASVPGWFRRLSPAGWAAGLVLGSHEAAVKSSCLALVAAFARTCGVAWLTPPDRLAAAEDKMNQYLVAQRLNVAAPTAVVCSSAPAAADIVGDPLVVKALGPGHFQEDDGKSRVVFATAVEAKSAAAASLGGAPFIVQRRVEAERHLRAVTVGDQLWVCEVAANQQELDWRADPGAHRSFRPLKVPRQRCSTERRRWRVRSVSATAARIGWSTVPASPGSWI